MKEKHEVNGRYQCPSCPETIKINQKRWKMKLEAHMAKNHGVGVVKVKKVQCDICGNEFANQSALNRHKLVVHEKKWTEVICDICGKVLKSKTHLYIHHKQKHAQYEVSEQDTKKKCEKCQEEFDAPEVFDGHLKTCLDELKDFKCSDCDLHWVSHLSLELHLTVSHKKVNFVCHLCGKCVTTQSRLDGHIKQIHDKSTQVVCHICALTCYSQGYYNKHMAVKHGIGELKHKCHHCDLKFYHESVLKEHVNVKHTQETIYKCEECPKTFLSKGVLTKHRKNAHTH